MTTMTVKELKAILANFNDNDTVELKAFENEAFVSIVAENDIEYILEADV